MIELKNNFKKKDGATAAGVHFLSDYQSCERYFYLRYVVGLMEATKADALTLGSCIHECLRIVHQENDVPKALAHAASLENEQLRMEAVTMFEKYVNVELASDQENYEILHSEELFEVPLKNGYIFTIKPDRIVRNRHSGRIVIIETKTTGWSVQETAKEVALNEQATAYIFGVLRCKPEYEADLSGVVPEIFYHRQSVMNVTKMPLVTRTKRDLINFELGVISLLEEISQKLQPDNLSQYPDAYLFRRRLLHGCTKFGRKCEYCEVCRMELKPGDSYPGFVTEVKDA